MPRRRILCTIFLIALALLALIFTAFPSSADSKLPVPTIAQGEALQAKMRRELAQATATRKAFFATSTTTTIKHVAETNQLHHRATPNTGGLSTPISPAGISDYHYLEPCIIQHESGGDPKNANPGSSARGIGQWLKTTWNNWGGYPSADLAPLEVQQARMDYDLGLGLKHIRQEWAAQIVNCHIPGA